MSGKRATNVSSVDKGRLEVVKHAGRRLARGGVDGVARKADRLVALLLCGTNVREREEGKKRERRRETHAEGVKEGVVLGHRDRKRLAATDVGGGRTAHEEVVGEELRHRRVEGVEVARTKSVLREEGCCQREGASEREGGDEKDLGDKGEEGV